MLMTGDVLETVQIERFPDECNIEKTYDNEQGFDEIK